MSGKTWSGWAAFFLAALILAGLSPALKAVTPGDPDMDGVPTSMELDSDPLTADSDHDGLLDGMERFILPGYQEDDADSDGNNILDGLEDHDLGGTSNGAEAANGSDPDDGGLDDELVVPPTIVGPLPSAPGFEPVSTDVWSPLSFDWSVGSYDKFVLEFDKTPFFANPVRQAYVLKPVGVSSLSGQEIGGLWKKITKKGRVVYWRVVGKEFNNGGKLIRKQPSMVSSFIIEVDGHKLITSGRFTGYWLVMISKEHGCARITAESS